MKVIDAGTQFDESDFLLNATDEGDRALNQILTARHGLLPDPDPDLELPTRGELDMEQAELLVTRTPVENIVVIGRDSDEPAANTAKERTWSILVDWESGVPFRQRGVPPVSVLDKTNGPFCTTILLEAAGLDKIYGPDREQRMKRALLIGQDYSDGGLYGAGQKTVDSGRARPILDVDWHDSAAFSTALAKYFGRRTDRSVIEETARRLARGLRTWAGEEVELFHVGEYYADLDNAAANKSTGLPDLSRGTLVWPGTHARPKQPQDFPDHPLGTRRLSPRMPRDPTLAGTVRPERTPRLRKRPFATGSSVLDGHARLPPDQPRPKKGGTDGEEEEEMPGGDGANVEEEAEEEEEDEEEGEERAAAAGASTAAKEPGAFGTKARKSFYDYGPASTHRLKHRTWERALVDECFVPNPPPTPPPYPTCSRKRHLSGAAQARKRRGLQLWSGRRKQRHDEGVDRSVDSLTVPSPTPRPPTSPAPEHGNLDKLNSLDVEMAEVTQDEDVEMAESTQDAETAETTSEAGDGRRRGYTSSGDRPRSKQGQHNHVRLFPFQHVARLLHFCTEQSLPWIRRAYSVWSLSSTNQQPTGAEQEAQLREVARWTAKRDGIARLGAAWAQPKGGSEKQDDQVGRIRHWKRDLQY